MPDLAENSLSGHQTPLQIGDVWSFLFRRCAAGFQLLTGAATIKVVPRLLIYEHNLLDLFTALQLYKYLFSPLSVMKAAPMNN